MTEGERNEPPLADDDEGENASGDPGLDSSNGSEPAPDEVDASAHGNGTIPESPDGKAKDGDLAAASKPLEIAGWLTGGLSKPRFSVSESSASSSLTPQVLPQDALDEEDLSVIPGARVTTWLGFRRRTWLGAAAAVVVLLLVFLFLRGEDQTEVANKGTSNEKATGTKLDTLVPAPGPELSEGEFNDGANSPGAHNRSLPLHTGLGEEPESPSTLMGPSGPSVARFPDLPREVLLELERAAKAKKSEPSEGATRAEAPESGVPTATVQAPVAATPTVQAPIIPAPTMPAPTMPAPTMPAPTMPAPTVPAPTVPAPTVQAPIAPAPT